MEAQFADVIDDRIGVRVAARCWAAADPYLKVRHVMHRNSPNNDLTVDCLVRRSLLAHCYHMPRAWRVLPMRDFLRVGWDCHSSSGSRRNGAVSTQLRRQHRPKKAPPPPRHQQPGPLLTAGTMIAKNRRRNLPQRGSVRSGSGTLRRTKSILCSMMRSGGRSCVVRWTWLPLPRLCSRSPRRREKQGGMKRGRGKKRCRGTLTSELSLTQ